METIDIQCVLTGYKQWVLIDKEIRTGIKDTIILFGMDKDEAIKELIKHWNNMDMNLQRKYFQPIQNKAPFKIVERQLYIELCDIYIKHDENNKTISIIEHLLNI